MSVRRIALACAFVALLVYLPSLKNRFALDDGAIVERNPAAHSIAAASRALTRPYWPPEHGAGLWRPAVILSFGIDWELSGGSAAWMHAVNAMLHALVTALVVLFVARYVGPGGAAFGGVIFAVHPVHVEAVANLVGRAELLAALGLLAALLFARASRRARAEGRVAWPAELAMLASIMLALLSKEHAAIAVVLLWLDDRARPDEPGRLPLRDYVAVVALTVAWLIARRAAEGGLSFVAVAPTFFHLGAVGRLSTMFPAVLVVLRLLVWPWDLSPDYHPRVIERLEHPTPEGVLGAAVLAACILLAVLLWRQRRAASLGLLIIGLAWLPTSNLLFASGIVLAERTLYTSTIGLALLAGLAGEFLVARFGTKISVLIGLAAAVPLAARSIDRIPDWASTRDLVVTALISHPESYKVHQSAARVFIRLGNRAGALREYRVAVELYPLDHYLLTEVAGLALEMGDTRLALRSLRAAEHLDTTYTLTHQFMAQALLRADSAPRALLEARRAVATGPTQAEAARMLAASFVALGQKDSAVAVWPAFLARGGSHFERWLLGAVTWATIGAADSAATAIDSAAALMPADTVDQRRLREARAEVQRLRQVPQ